MPIPVTFFIGYQLLSMLTSSMVGLVGVWYLRRALSREIVAAGVEQWSPEIYLRFVGTHARIAIVVGRVNRIIVLIMLLGIVALAFSFVPFRNLVLISPSIWALIIGLSAGTYISGLVKAVFVDVEVLRIVQESSLRRGDIFTLAIKNFLFNWLPSFLFQEALGILLLLRSNPILCLCLFLLFTAIRIIGLLFAVPFLVLSNQLRPIEQTQWAGLAPRITAWARLVSVEFASVHVQRGGIGFGLVGLGRPALIIGETFLRYSEWRQQDALIGIAIGLVRKHTVCKSFLAGMLAAALIVAFFVTFSLPTSSLGLFPQVIILLVYFILFWGVQIGFLRPLHAASFCADRMAILLTGDPGAVIVTLNTIQALSGLPATRRLAYGFPRTSDRMKKLKKLARQSWQLAPQSTALVPAITEASLGSYNLTTSFTQADSPGPVPSAPYADLAKA